MAHSAAAPAAPAAPAPLVDRLTVGSRVVIAADTDVRGAVSIASGTVVHPKASLLALAGPIFIGSDNIIEEHVVIVNRGRGGGGPGGGGEAMRIGDANLFEVGCRVEAARVGSHNHLEPRSHVGAHVELGSFCHVGAGCSLRPTPQWPDGAADAMAGGAPLQSWESGGGASRARRGGGRGRGGAGREGEGRKHDGGEDDGDDDDGDDRDGVGGGNDDDDDDKDGSATRAVAAAAAARERIPDRTVVWGDAAEPSRRTWSGEGVRQAQALHAKHLEYLREILPKLNKLKIIQ